MSSTTQTTTTDAALFAFMQASHRALQLEFARLLDAVIANDQAEINDRWGHLEADLLAHMETEERFVIPTFARVELGEATALIREHGVIRQQLLELGVAVELHYLRAEPCAQFIETLRAHAAREDELLYRWAATRLDGRFAAAARQHLDRVRDRLS